VKSPTFGLEDSAWFRGVYTCAVHRSIVVVELPFLLPPISIWSRKPDAWTCLLLLRHFRVAVVDISTSCAETKAMHLKSILLQAKQASMPRLNDNFPWRQLPQTSSVLSRSPYPQLQ
jgi:hypothetical protein